LRKEAPNREVSMSTSLLYHAFGIRGYQYTRTDYPGGETVFTIHQKPETCRCSACGSAQVQMRGRVERRFRTLSIGSRATFVILPIPRVECQACGVVRQVKILFADPRRTYTSAFERYALELGRRMTIRDVAKHLGVSWDVIKDIQKRDLSRRFAKPKLKHLQRIAIDEISIAKGHRYLTVVMDLESGAVVFVGDGKGADALKPFWKRLRGSKAKVEAVAMDMSAAYREAVSTHLPKAKIVFDRFHVMKLFNEKLSDLRRALHREATDMLQKKVLKGTRWLLLKAAENLDEERDEKTKLEEALALNKSLATAYYLKEDLRQFWEQPGKKFGTLFLNGWIKRAEASGIKILQQMAKTLAAHRSGLLAYHDVMITSGPMEGTNNKIKTMKRQAYGFRDKEFFKLKILAIHETRYELVG
jgi:transposase